MSKQRTIRVALLGLVTLAACDRVNGAPEGNVRVQLAVTPVSGTSAGASTAADPLVLSGNNGTLSLTDLRLIVSRIKLDGDEHGCDTARTGSNNCKDFSLPPSLVQIPLTSGAVTVAAGSANPGTYTEVELRVKNLDVDDDGDEDDMNDDGDHGDRAALAKALADARAVFADWPDRASMVVTCTFTPKGTGQQPIAFKVYFRAELKIEMPLVPPLVVTATGASRTVTVNLKPDVWFKGADGKVADLSDLDFTKTRKVIEFKPEAKKGFRAKHDG